MLGYKSSSIMAQELANRADGLKPLTFRQVNYVLDRLHERRFFARARANERQTFYSIRLPQDQLENRLVESKSYLESFHEQRMKRERIWLREHSISLRRLPASETVTT